MECFEYEGVFTAVRYLRRLSVSLLLIAKEVNRRRLLLISHLWDNNPKTFYMQERECMMIYALRTLHLFKSYPVIDIFSVLPDVA